MPLYEYRCEACQTALRGDQEVLGSRTGRVHALWQGPGAAPDVVARDSVQGIGLVHHRLLAEGEEQRARAHRHVESLADSKPATVRRPPPQHQDQKRRHPPPSRQPPNEPTSAERSARRCPDGLVERVEIATESLGELRTLQREVRRRLQEARACCRRRAARR